VHNDVCVVELTDLTGTVCSLYIFSTLDIDGSTQRTYLLEVSARQLFASKQPSPVARGYGYERYARS
jgi:hypothetical protein